MAVMLLHGDSLTMLKTLEDRSVHCCISSPPYWGLRDYGTATWEGGDPECDHSRQSIISRTSSCLEGATTTQGGKIAYGSECGKCGARRIDDQIGLEATPENYVEKLVAVFREVRRVLRDDGTLWLNLGDTYNAYNGGAGPGSTLSKIQTEQRPQLSTGYGLQCKTLKPKDLVGIPWRVAFALQEEGWYLRSDIIWSKPNPMPESVTDRPTKSHEYIFLLSKNQKYYFDQEAVREKAAEWPANKAGRKQGEASRGYPGSCQLRSSAIDRLAFDGRNIRTVWTVATQPYPDAHFAVFPEKLIVPCVKAGCPEGGTILDPFSGEATTGVVALKFGREYIGIELNKEYLERSQARLDLILNQPSLPL